MMRNERQREEEEAAAAAASVWGEYAAECMRWLEQLDNVDSPAYGKQLFVWGPAGIEIGEFVRRKLLLKLTRESGKPVFDPNESATGRFEEFDTAQHSALLIENSEMSVSRVIQIADALDTIARSAGRRVPMVVSSTVAPPSRRNSHHAPLHERFLVVNATPQKHVLHLMFTPCAKCAERGQ